MHTFIQSHIQTHIQAHTATQYNTDISKHRKRNVFVIVVVVTDKRNGPVMHATRKYCNAYALARQLYI